MIQEKSCGAVVYRGEAKELQVLLICHKKGGHWSFPKGHVEQGETEEETAHREIVEETGLLTKIDAGFRTIVSYAPKPDVIKEVIYFAAVAIEGSLQRQECEVVDLLWAPLEEAQNKITYDNDRQVLSAFQSYLRKRKLKRSLLQTYVKNSNEAVRLYQMAFDAPLITSYLNPDGTFCHAEIGIYGQVLAVSEADSSQDGTRITGNTMQFCLHFGEGNESYVRKAYDILKKDAKILYPLGPCEYSPLMADFIDQFGVRWCLFV